MTKSAKVVAALVAFGSSATSVSSFVARSSCRSSLRHCHHPYLRHQAKTAVASSLEQNIRMMGSSSNNEVDATTETTAVVVVAENLQYVRNKIQSTCEASNRSVEDVRLVAVSKTKPLELLQQAYDASQRIFGENYAQELVEKAAQMPHDVEWHFIGNLQSNKANMLVKSVVPVSAKLTVETVSSLKLANKLNNAMESLEEDDDDKKKKLNIFVQINTSGEDSKSGIEPSEAVSLCREISEQCDRLSIQGLMTIGAPGDLGCFDTLIGCRDKVCAELGWESLELSMGMSGDFEAAIERGATNVRVGSTIFGARDYSNKT